MWHVKFYNGEYHIYYDLDDKYVCHVIPTLVWERSTNQLALLKFTILRMKREMACGT